MEIAYRHFSIVKSPVSDEWVAWAGSRKVMSAKSCKALKQRLDVMARENDKDYIGSLLDALRESIT